MEHSWEKQRRPMAFDRIHQRALRYRYSGNEADASSISGKYKHISSNEIIKENLEFERIPDDRINNEQVLVVVVPFFLLRLSRQESLALGFVVFFFSRHKSDVQLAMKENENEWNLSFFSSSINTDDE